MSVPPTIALGSTDTASVVAAQRDLNVADAREQSAGRNGLINCPLTEDGIFGTKTEQAVFDFQQIRGLAVDGIIGPNTWTQLQAGVNPDSGVSSAVSLPIEGAPRWSVSVNDIVAKLGQGPTAAQLAGVTVAVGGKLAAKPLVSPDGRLIYFTPSAGAEGPADLVITGGDGSTFVLEQAIPNSSSFAAALEGLCVAVALSIQEAALTARALEVGRLRAFVDGVALALRAYQDLLGQMLDRLQDPGGSPTAQDGAAWVAHMATRTRMVADIINEQCHITLGTDAIADLDGLPFGGADDEPTLDTGATVLLLTALENVVVPSIVDLTA
jgi:peptidoglycan hydrolase-like protein with peptidoglycan-binding domain